MEVKPKGLAEVVNVTLVRNGNHKDSRVALVKRSEGLNGALKIAKNKFKIKVLKVFIRVTLTVTLLKRSKDM